MKKLTYLLGLLLVGSLIFTSCGDDDPVEPDDLTPSIDFTVGGEDVVVTLGDTVAFQVVCASNSISGKKLDKYEIYMIVNNENTGSFYEVNDIDDAAFTDYIGIPTGFSPVAFEGKVYAKITDVDGQYSEVSFNLTVEAAATPLDGEEDMEWQRVGGNAGTGLDMFGLKWTSNVKEVMAVIQKDGADKLVQFESTYWDGITTKEELMAAVDAMEDLGDDGYRGVSAEANDDYDDVLGVKLGEEYFILHITNGTVEVDPVTGTTITITGMYNK